MTTKNKLKKFEQILLLGLMSTLMACQAVPQCPEMPMAPTKPTLPSIRTTQTGEMVLSRDDAAALGLYILELEKGYK